MFMKRNVYLVDLGTASNRNLLPLGVGLISAYCGSLPDLSSEFNFNVHFLRGSTSGIVDTFDAPFVVGYAMYVWNFRASLRLSAATKAAHPDAVLVAGGYSIPKDPERVRLFFKEFPQFDILVHGEGEFTFAEVMRVLSSGRGLQDVEGISFRTNMRPEGFLTTPKRDRIMDLNVIPSPYLNGVFDDILHKHKDKVTGVIWETNRGCPFACTFCDWGNADVNKLKRFDMERLSAEIDWISDNDIFYIYLADANFGILNDRDMEIARKISNAGKKKGFPGFMAVNWTKNTHERIVKIAEVFDEGNVMTSVTLAVQSFNDKTLEAIKRKNIKTEDLLKLKQEFHDRNLPTYTEMILGLPEETYLSFVHGLDQAMTSRLSDHWVFHLCTLLKNTEMESDAYREKYGIEAREVEAAIARRQFKDDVDQDAEIEEIVVGTKAMPSADWKRAFTTGYMSSALYNFRSAFFIMNYLANICGNTHTQFVEFVIDEVNSDGVTGFKGVGRGLAHISQQYQLILDNISCLSSVDELGGATALAHEAGFALFLSDPDTFYNDMKELAQRFLRNHDVEPDQRILDGVMGYQRARMPLWGRPEQSSISFEHNIPAYFDAVTKGVNVPDIEPGAWEMKVVQEPTQCKDECAFAVQRTRSGHTIYLNEVTFEPARLDVDEALSIAS